MICKIYKKTPCLFFMVIDNLYLAKWEEDLLNDIIDLSLGNCLKIINVVSENEKIDLFKDKINKKYLSNSSLFLKKRIDDKILKMIPEIINMNKDDSLLYINESDSLQEIDFVLNFSIHKIEIQNLNIFKGVWSMPFSHSENVRLIDFFIKSFTADAKTISLKFNVETIENNKTSEVLCHTYSSFFITIDELEVMINDLKQTFLNLLFNEKSNYKKLNRGETLHDNNSKDLSFFGYVEFKRIHFSDYLKKLIRSEFLNETWNIALSKKNVESLLTYKDTHVNSWVWHNKKKDYKFVADPFLMDFNGKSYLLAEAIGDDSEKGLLVSYEIDLRSLKLKEPSILYKTDHHLSYPYLINHNDEIFCIPESSEISKLNLYKFIDFPNTWTKVATLIAGRTILDASVIFYNNIWWLFCSESDNGPLSKLSIWYSDVLVSDWTEHEKNPVISDIRCGRSGGAPFIYKDKLYRPAQNGSISYGGQLNLMEIQVITKTNYCEKHITTIDPVQNSEFKDGIHTLSFSKDLMVIDGKQLSFSYRMFWKWLLVKLRVN